MDLSPTLSTKTPVTYLQQFCSKKGLVPEYTLVRNGTGDHNPNFIYQVSICGKTAIGEGKSKKEAKHAAAKKLLNIVNETAREVEDVVVNPYTEELKENAVGALQEFCLTYMINLPKYEVLSSEGPPHDKRFDVKCTVSSFFTLAEGRTKQQGKQNAAHLMLLKLKNVLKDGNLIAPEKRNTLSLIERRQNKAIERLCQRLEKEVVIKNEKEPKVGFFNYDTIFKQEKFVSCEELKEIKGKKDDYFNQIVNPFKLFEILMIKIDLNWEKSDIPLLSTEPGCLLCIQIKSLGNATFLGWGNDENSALQSVSLSALKWFSVMSL